MFIRCLIVIFCLSLSVVPVCSRTASALAPPPINFERETFIDDGTEYVILWDDEKNELKMVAVDGTGDSKHNKALWGVLGCLLFLASSCGVMSGILWILSLWL